MESTPVRGNVSRRRAWCVAGLAMAVAAGSHVIAQKLTPVEAAARLSGTWTFNAGLSKGFNAPGAPRGGGPARGGALYAIASSPAQRGGGGGQSGPSDLSPAELAAQAAMRQLQQLADEITIDASVERVTFRDARGERIYTVDGKNAEDHRRRRRGFDEVALGQDRAQAGVLDRVSQADADMGCRRERTAGPDGEDWKASGSSRRISEQCSTRSRARSSGRSVARLLGRPVASGFRPLLEIFHGRCYIELL